MQEEKIILEYNETQHCFHNNFFSGGKLDKPLFSFGWKPICLIPQKYAVPSKDNGFDKLIESCVLHKLSFEDVYKKIIYFLIENE